MTSQETELREWSASIIDGLMECLGLEFREPGYRDQHVEQLAQVVEARAQEIAASVAKAASFYGAQGTTKEQP